MRKQLLLMILSGLALAGPAWGEAFDEGKRAYFRGNDKQALTLLRQAVKERPRDPLRREWLAKVYDRTLRPFEALIERDVAAKLRATMRHPRQNRSRIRIGQGDVAWMGPVTQSVKSPAPQPGSSPPAVPEIRDPVAAAPSEKFSASLSVGENGGFQVHVTAFGAEAENRIKSVRSVLVTLELSPSGGTYQISLLGSSGTLNGSSLTLVNHDRKIQTAPGDDAQKAAKARVSIQYAEGQEALPAFDINGLGLYVGKRPDSNSQIEPPRLPG